MDFFRFRLSRDKDEHGYAVARLIHSINLEGQGHIDIGFRIEKINDLLMCTLYTDEDKVRNVITKLPIFVSKVERKTPIKADMMYGHKIIDKNHPLAMNMWLCGYIAEGHINKNRILDVQNLLNENVQKYFDNRNNKKRPLFIIDENKCFINNKAYYPVMFFLEPKTLLGKIATNRDYNKDLKSTYNCFYNVAYSTLVREIPGSVLKADICGNTTTLTLNNRGYKDLPFDVQEEDLLNVEASKELSLVKSSAQ